MQWFLQQHSLELGDEANVKTAAMLAKQMAYQNKVRRTTSLHILPHHLWPRQHRSMAQQATPLTSATISLEVLCQCLLSSWMLYLTACFRCPTEHVASRANCGGLGQA